MSKGEYKQPGFFLGDENSSGLFYDGTWQKGMAQQDEAWKSEVNKKYSKLPQGSAEKNAYDFVNNPRNGYKLKSKGVAFDLGQEYYFFVPDDMSGFVEKRDTGIKPGSFIKMKCTNFTSDGCEMKDNRLINEKKRGINVSSYQPVWYRHGTISRYFFNDNTSASRYLTNPGRISSKTYDTGLYGRSGGKMRTQKRQRNQKRERRQRRERTQKHQRTQKRGRTQRKQRTQKRHRY
jgi:hypothetical protein